MSDHRDIAAGVHSVFDTFDAGAMRATFTRETPKGVTITHTLALVFVVCPTCEGRGTHVHPGIDSHGLTAEDFAEDPDFREDYFSGCYDVACAQCKGLRVVPDVDASQTKPAILAAYHAAVDASWESARQSAHERAMGYLAMILDLSSQILALHTFGKAFIVRAIVRSAGAANALCAQHPEWAVIAEQDDLIFVADSAPGAPTPTTGETRFHPGTPRHVRQAITAARTVAEAPAPTTPADQLAADVLVLGAYFTPAQLATIANGLDIAIRRFDDNAAAMRDEAAKVRDQNTPLEDRASPISTAKGYERLAEQFERQAADTRALQTRFADL